MDEGDDSFLSIPSYNPSGHVSSDAGDTLLSHSTVDDNAVGGPSVVCNAGHPGESDIEHFAHSASQFGWDIEASMLHDTTSQSVPVEGTRVEVGAHQGEVRPTCSPAHVSRGLRRAFLADCPPTMSTLVPDPFGKSGEAIIAFGPSPLSSEEVSALRELSKEKEQLQCQELSPIAAVVRRLFETIRFQRRELDEVKGAEVRLAETALDDERRRHSIVLHRSTRVIEALERKLRLLQTEHARCGPHDSESSSNDKASTKQAEYIFVLEQELTVVDKARQEILALAKLCCPSLSDDSTPADVLNALKATLQNLDAVSVRPRVGSSASNSLQEVASSSLTHASPMELEHYGQRLLDLERIFKDTEDRCAILCEEKAELSLRLAELEGRSSGPMTPGSMTPGPMTPGRLPSDVAEDDAESGQLREDLRASQEAVFTLRAEVDELRDEVLHLKSEREQTAKKLMETSLQLDSARSQKDSESAARAKAVQKQDKLADELDQLRSKHERVFSELTENTVMAVKELQRKESTCQQLQEMLAERQHRCASQERDVASLSANVQELEKELLKSTEQLAARVSAVDHPRNDDGAGVQDTSKHLGIALLEKTTELAAVKSEHESLVRALSSVKEECRELKEAARMHHSDTKHSTLPTEFSCVAENSKSTYPFNEPAVGTHEEETFLRRLSARLGCPASSSRELLSKLVDRVEQLMEERRDFEDTIDRLRGDIVKRERSLHLMRSEFSAEVSALKAELSYVENDRARAVADREAAELRYLECAKREETGTVSINEDMSQPSFFGRESFAGRADSTLNFDDASQWEDPSIQAAIKSLDVLIGSKADLDARNNALKDQLNRLANRGFENERGSSAATRAVAIESRTLNEELVGIVSLQQKVIQKLRAASGRRGSYLQSHQNSNTPSAPATADDSVCTSPQPLVKRQDDGHLVPYTRRDTLSDAADFLQGQLQGMRSLCEERAQANVKLHGVVREMELQLQQTSDAKKDTEMKLQATLNEQTSLMSRLAHAAGATANLATLTDVEVFVCASISSIRTLESSLDRCESRCGAVENRLLNALAQKCVLSRIIGLYVGKYQLDILSSDARAPVRAVTKVRRVVSVIIAAARVRRALQGRCDAGIRDTSRDRSLQVGAQFNVPTEVNFLGCSTGGVPPGSAVVALKAIPKLESALADRDAEVARLQRAIAALEASSSRKRGDDNPNEIPSAFDYEGDVVNRKNDLARRLHAARKERDQLALRLMREKRERQALEVKNSKYMSKLSSYQRRLGKAKNNAESQERFYKNAILYLRKKADHAVRNDDFTDFAEFETGLLLEQSSAEVKENLDVENTPGNYQEDHPKGKKGAASRTDISERAKRAVALIEEQIRAARAELTKPLHDGTNQQELESYVAGLEKAAAEVRMAM